MNVGVASSWLAMVGVVLALVGPAQAQDLKVCKSTFALCTVARCDPIPGNDKQVICHCTVNKGYSAGTQDCSSIVETPKKASKSAHATSRSRAMRPAATTGRGPSASTSPA